ncbi:MAG: hypothetical protein QXX99_06675, partial [Candidatus Bathyarchaeia archaeon]
MDKCFLQILEMFRPSFRAVSQTSWLILIEWSARFMNCSYINTKLLLQFQEIPPLTNQYYDLDIIYKMQKKAKQRVHQNILCFFV